MINSTRNIGPELKIRIPSETALHFDEKHYWIPELNLTVYDLDDITSDGYIIPERDQGFIIATEGHEQAHSFFGRTGTVANRFSWFIQAEEVMIKTPKSDFDLAMNNQIATDIIHMESRNLMEAGVAFFISCVLNHMNSDSTIKYDEKVLTEIEVNRDKTLARNSIIKELYDRMIELKKWTNSEFFTMQVIEFALEIPYVLPHSDIRRRQPKLNPTFRFEETVNVLEILNNKKSLKDRSSFSKAILYNKIADPKTSPHLDISKMDVFKPLYDITSFPFGDVNFNHELHEYFELIQFWKVTDPFTNVAKDEKLIKGTEENIRKKLGKYFPEVFLSRNHNYVYVVFKLGDTHYFVPNIHFIPRTYLNDWENTYLYWAIKDALLKNDDKENILNLCKIFLPKGDYNEFEKMINSAYTKIDYSKINEITINEFKETSKQLGRKLNWN